MAELLPYQIEPRNALVDILLAHNVAVLAADTGTGKSYVSASVCVELGCGVLIVGPKAGIPAMYHVFTEFNVPILGNVNYEAIKNGKYYTSLDNFMADIREPCPYIEVVRVGQRDSITKKKVYTAGGAEKMVISHITWNLPPHTVVIFDEAHKARNGLASGVATGNSKLLVSVRSYLEDNVYALLLSATISDLLKNFDVVAYTLGLFAPYNKKVYAQYLRRVGIKENDAGFKKLHSMLFPKRAQTMTISHIKRYYPGIFRDSDIQAVALPVDKATAENIEQLHEQIQVELAQLHARGQSGGWGIIVRLWQEIEILKVMPTVKVILDELRQGRSVVVFVNFNKTKKLLTTYCCEKGGDIIANDRIGYIDGAQTTVERQHTISAFQSNRLHLLICQIKAGGVAISLHHVQGDRPRSSVGFPTWSATDTKQWLGRIDRAGSLSDSKQYIVYVKYVVTEGDTENHRNTLTVEEKLQAKASEKLRNLELLNNGDLTGFISIIEE